MIVIPKLFYTEPWLQELHTKIHSQHQEGRHHLVVLEETIFYPTGGGQPHDLGSINGIPLLEVFERAGIIYHALDQALRGEEAFCVLDWSRRLDHMQQHSGQHLLSAIFQDERGYRTESFHLGEEYCSIDISTPTLPKEEQTAVETKVNQVIFSNLPVLTYTLAPGDLSKVPLRKKPDIEGPLRIVEIEKLDYSPCSGTHVTSTAQIGLVKIIKSENYKGMTRVYFLCGGRAFRDYRLKQEICASLGILLSVPEGELESRVGMELERKRELEKRAGELQMELTGFKARDIVAHETSPFYLDSPGASIEEAQNLARSILDLTTASVVINLGERLVLAHNLPTSLHLGQLIKETALPLGGRGGGSASSAQVYFSSPNQLQEFLHVLMSMTALRFPG